ncbi:hypothetical protein D3C76_1768540 [compost metagenome]
MARFGTHEPFNEFADAIGCCLTVAPLQVGDNPLKGNERILPLSEVIFIPEADLLAACTVQQLVHMLG